MSTVRVYDSQGRPWDVPAGRMKDAPASLLKAPPAAMPAANDSTAALSRMRLDPSFAVMDQPEQERLAGLSAHSLDLGSSLRNATQAVAPSLPTMLAMGLSAFPATIPARLIAALVGGMSGEGGRQVLMGEPPSLTRAAAEGGKQAGYQTLGEGTAMGANAIAQPLMAAGLRIGREAKVRAPWLVPEAMRQGTKVGDLPFSPGSSTAAADPLAAGAAADRMTTRIGSDPLAAGKRLNALGRAAAADRAAASTASQDVVKAADASGQTFTAAQVAADAVAKEEAKLQRPLTKPEYYSVVNQVRGLINDALAEPFGVGGKPRTTFKPSELDRARQILDARNTATYNKAARGQVAPQAASDAELRVVRGIRDLLHENIDGLGDARSVEQQAIKVAEASKAGSANKLFKLAEEGNKSAQRLAVQQAIRDGNMATLEWFAAKGDPEAKAGVIGLAARKGDKAKLFKLAEAGDATAQQLSVEHAISDRDRSTLEWWAAKGDQRARNAILASQVASAGASKSGKLIPSIFGAAGALIPGQSLPARIGEGLSAAVLAHLLGNPGLQTRAALMAAHPMTGAIARQLPRLGGALLFPPQPQDVPAPPGRQPGPNAQGR